MDPIWDWKSIYISIREPNDKNMYFMHQNVSKSVKVFKYYFVSVDKKGYIWDYPLFEFNFCKTFQTDNRGFFCRGNL